jgi:hypothetical protein
MDLEKYYKMSRDQIGQLPHTEYMPIAKHLSTKAFSPGGMSDKEYELAGHIKHHFGGDPRTEHPGIDDTMEDDVEDRRDEPEEPEEPSSTPQERPETPDDDDFIGISLGSKRKTAVNQRLSPEEQAKKDANLAAYIQHAGEAERTGRTLQSYLPKKESRDFSDNIDLLIASTYMNEIANINDDQFIIEHVILGLEEELQVELTEEEILNILENIDEEMLMEAKKKGPSGISGMIMKLAVKMGYNPKEKRKSGDVVQMIKNLAKGKGLKTDRGLKPKKPRKSTPRKPKEKESTAASTSPSQEKKEETPKGPPPETRRERMLGSGSDNPRAVDPKHRVERLFKRTSEETNENYEVMADKIINALQNEINESFTLNERQILREVLVEEIKNEKQ